MTRRGYHNRPRLHVPASPGQWRSLAWKAGLAALQPGPATAAGQTQLRDLLRGVAVDSFPDQTMTGRACASALVQASRAYVETTFERAEILKPLIKAASEAVETLLGPVGGATPYRDD